MQCIVPTKLDWELKPQADVDHSPHHAAASVVTWPDSGPADIDLAWAGWSIMRAGQTWSLQVHCYHWRNHNEAGLKRARDDGDPIERDPGPGTWPPSPQTRQDVPGVSCRVQLQGPGGRDVVSNRIRVRRYWGPNAELTDEAASGAEDWIESEPHPGKVRVAESEKGFRGRY